MFWDNLKVECCSNNFSVNCSGNTYVKTMHMCTFIIIACCVYITLRPTVTATGLVNEEWQILTPYKIETSEPIDIKFGTGNVRERTPYGANPFAGSFWANRWTVTLLTFLLLITTLGLIKYTQHILNNIKFCWNDDMIRLQFSVYIC